MTFYKLLTKTSTKFSTLFTVCIPSAVYNFMQNCYIIIVNYLTRHRNNCNTRNKFFHSIVYLPTSLSNIEYSSLCIPAYQDITYKLLLHQYDLICF